MRAVLALLVAGAAVSVAASARADTGPPRGYVEKCTAAREQKPGLACYGCGASVGRVDRCSKLLDGHGFTRACRSYGASAWTEVWCRPAGGPALPPEVAAAVTAPTPEQLAAVAAEEKSGATTAPGAGPVAGGDARSGCGACGVAGPSIPGALGVTALAGVAAILGLRRRRR